MSASVVPFSRLARVVGVVGVVGVVAVIGVGCAPFGEQGSDCRESPCAVGLVCVEADDGGRVCDEPPPPPSPPCTDDAECGLDGDTSGRVCTDGVCGFAACSFDVQCGTRICLDGQCAETEVCLDDDDCDGGLCDLGGGASGVCRPPCFGDEDCGGAIGGIPLQTCSEGRCLQRCLNDLTCFGQGLCEAGACVPVECVDSGECDGGGDGGEFCDGGRCTSFTPCAQDDDCFDPNLFCDTGVEPVRCAERAACRADNECGLEALCLDRHCRPATACFDDGDCDSAGVAGEDECVGGRCVKKPDCRASVDCAASEVCADLRCVTAPDDVAPASVVVEDRLAPCAAVADATPCRRSVFVDERLSFTTRGFDPGGLPVPGAVRATVSGVIAVVDEGADDGAERANNVVTLVGATAGAGSVAFGDVVVDIAVVAATAPLSVLVAEADGAPAVGAVVVVVDGADRGAGNGADDSVTTDGAGLAAIADPGAFDVDDVVIVTLGERTSIVPRPSPAAVGAAATLRVILPRIADAPTAALRVTISSTGDETGPVGVGLALPSPQSFAEVSFRRLFGDVVQGQAELPVIGAVPVALSSSMTLEASLPLVGDQVIRAEAEVVVPPGPSFVFALEDRREQQDLVALALGGDPTTTALDFAEQSEGMDAALTAGGNVVAGATTADLLDRDGDGDTSELIPDFAVAPVVEARPFGPPRQRTSVVAQPPQGANERALVAIGFALPGHFLISGTGVVRGALGFEDVPLAEPVKLIPASTTTHDSPAVVVVSAVFDDERLASRARFIATAPGLVPAVVDIGPLLDPPEGGFLLRDLPGDGDISVVLPAVPPGLLRIALRSTAGARIELWASSDSAVRLPAGFDDVTLEEVRLYELDDVDGNPFATGLGPIDVEKSARRVASAPAP